MGLSNPLDDGEIQPKTIDPVPGAVFFQFSVAFKRDLSITLNCA